MVSTCPTACSTAASSQGLQGPFSHVHTSPQALQCNCVGAPGLLSVLHLLCCPCQTCCLTTAAGTTAAAAGMQLTMACTLMSM